ncbi:anti-anti-sigma factor [Amylibacter kogurei]|uniref:Anti-sigma factor antagonist n=1 Tax=Paramylibacter kogurei TaxID=1889778 RepID=A0A2G5K0Z6_9RHOB|nr:STAS domain-containing protein [Amylibacter kogurei]PIB23181.1 anti-anti-sigma factor [Amylibacter kogurei]
MEISVDQYGHKTVVKLRENRLDAAMAVRFKDALKTVVDDGAEFMILDMSDVGFMDSSGLGAVVAHMKYMGTERNFEIANLTPTVEKVFKLTRMDSVFKIHKSIADAIPEDLKNAI